MVMTMEQYEQHRESSDGLCLNCGAIRYGDTEPDAEDYYCEDCDENRVIGIENAMMEGHIEVTK